LDPADKQAKAFFGEKWTSDSPTKNSKNKKNKKKHLN
jgi:hypothetical protein